MNNVIIEQQNDNKNKNCVNLYCYNQVILKTVLIADKYK